MKRSLALLLVCAMAASASAALTMIDDFESYSLGSINGVGAWDANKNSSQIGDSGYSNVVTVDGDKALQLTNRDSDGAIDTVYTCLDLGANTITGSGTLYLRYKADGPNDTIIGFNDLLPGFASDGATDMEDGYQGATTYSSQGAIVRLSGGEDFRARHDGGYLNTPMGQLANTWYEMWIHFDVANDQSQYFICEDGGTPQVVMNPSTNDVWWGFRNDSYDQISSMKIFAGMYPWPDANVETNVFIDTIAVDNAMCTLARVADVPEPATMSLLGLGALALIRRKK